MRRLAAALGHDAAKTAAVLLGAGAITYQLQALKESLKDPAAAHQEALQLFKDMGLDWQSG